MNSEFWKQFAGTPSINCVQMKHDIQAKIYEETKDMTWEERRAYYQRGSEAFRRESAQRQAACGDAVLREEPTAYGSKPE